MSWLTRLLTGGDGAQAQSPDPLDDFWYTALGQQASSGVRVTPEKARAISAVFGCVRVISEDVGKLPFRVYADDGAAGKSIVANHPIAQLMRRPNPWQTAQAFFEMLTGHAMLRGNAVARKVIDPSTGRMMLVPIHPDRITEIALEGGDKVIRVRTDAGTTDDIPGDQVLHLMGLSDDGITGLSVVGLARESFGLAIATESYGSRFFSQNARPSGVLEHPGTLSPEAFTRLRKNWQETYAGLDNAMKVAILEGGMKWTQIGMTSEDAQFLETRKFQAADAARWFRMPPHKVGIMDNATFSNIEHQALEYVIDALMPWLVRWESAIERDLMGYDVRYFPKFRVQGLLRGDIMSRYQAYAIARNWGWMNVDEIREEEDMNPLPDGTGKIYLQPLNMGLPGETGMKPKPAPPPDPSQQAKEPPPLPPANGQARLLAHELAARIVHREISLVRRAITKHAGDDDAWREWVTEFYDGHAAELARAMHIPDHEARAYAEQQAEELMEGGARAVEQWAQKRPAELAAMALGGEAA